MTLPEAVARCVAPGAPLEMRLAVARGAIPLEPGERLVSLAVLAADPEAAVRDAVVSAVLALPAAFVAQGLGVRSLPEAALDLVAATRAGESALRWLILEHPHLGRPTLERFLDLGDGEALERLALNQRVLDRHPDLGRQLAAHDALGAEARARLVTLYGSPEESEEAIPDAPLPADLPQELLVETPAVVETPNLYQLVQSLSVAQKIKLALLGSKAARRLLIRDTNRAVALAVIRSPLIREDEVQTLAQDRTLSDDVLRVILGRKDWLKNYPIRLALAQNPKTPVPKALRLLETLQERDLRNLARSRNVPSPVSSGAARVLARRGKL